MLSKSTQIQSDVLVYDLEDSVAPANEDKDRARGNLKELLSDGYRARGAVGVRLNDVSTAFFREDADVLANPLITTLILPKIHSKEDLDYASSFIRRVRHGKVNEPLKIVPSVESARAMWNLGSIASWTSEHGPEGGVLSALLFAAEDYCADTSILRSPSRLELLYTRSQIVIAAKAHGLEAIDMVCVNYKDADYLKEECEDGRRLGFTGKQAIHPTQVGTIQSTFVPTSAEILRAAKIIRSMERAHASGLGTGAVGLEGEMIDAPMIKQAEITIRIAKAAKLEIPVID